MHRRSAQRLRPINEPMFDSAGYPVLRTPFILKPLLGVQDTTVQGNCVFHRITTYLGAGTESMTIDHWPDGGTNRVVDALV